MFFNFCQFILALRKFARRMPAIYIYTYKCTCCQGNWFIADKARNIRKLRYRADVSIKGSSKSRLNFARFRQLLNYPRIQVITSDLTRLACLITSKRFRKTFISI